MSSALPYLHLRFSYCIIHSMLFLLLRTILSALRSHRALAMENLALRHQLNVLKRDVKRPRLKNRDRLLWVMLVRLWNDWRKPLILVQPETVIRWHKKGFRLYWRWKSRPRRPGRKRSLRISVILSVLCLETIPFGELPGFMVSCSNSASRLAREQSPSIWFTTGSLRLRAGAPS